jgi:hypothetical protein
MADRDNPRTQRTGACLDRVHLAFTRAALPAVPSLFHSLSQDSDLCAWCTAHTILIMNGSETGDPGFEDDFPNAADDHAGDYSVRLEEILDDDARPMNGTDDNDDDEGFVYQGVDAAPVPSRGAYRSQLRNILGADHEDDELEEQKAEKPLHVPEDDTMPLVRSYMRRSTSLA